MGYFDARQAFNLSEGAPFPVTLLNKEKTYFYDTSYEENPDGRVGN